jgi:hypothetical protein
MPYTIKKKKQGYKVCKKKGGKCFSKKPLTKKRAVAQMGAIMSNENKTPLELLFIEACWNNYKQVGMKKKGSRMVPNCVLKKKSKAKR